MSACLTIRPSVFLSVCLLSVLVCHTHTHTPGWYALQRSRDDAKSQVTAMKQEVEQALQHVQSAHKERDIARDLASSLLQEQANLKQQLAVSAQSKAVAQVTELT